MSKFSLSIPGEVSGVLFTLESSCVVLLTIRTMFKPTQTPYLYITNLYLTHSADGWFPDLNR